jgi:hypothetical protein
VSSKFPNISTQYMVRVLYYTPEDILSTEVMPGTPYKMIRPASFTDLLASKYHHDYGSINEDDQISSTTSPSSCDDDLSDDEDDLELCSRCRRYPKEQAISMNQLPCLCKKNESSLGSKWNVRATSMKNLKELEKEKKRICERSSTKMDPCYFQVHSSVQVQMPELNGLIEEEEEETIPCAVQQCAIFNARRFGSFGSLRS